MTHRITYSDDAWNLAGSADFDGRSSAFLHFDRIPERWRDLVKDYVLLIGDPALARTGAPGASATRAAAEPTGRPHVRPGNAPADSVV